MSALRTAAEIALERLPKMRPEVAKAVAEYRNDSKRYRYHTADELGILLDETTAVCSLYAFETLLDYSASIPTGTFEGKVWRRTLRDDDFNVTGYMLGEYRLDEDPEASYPNMVRIIWRDLEVVS